MNLPPAGDLVAEWAKEPLALGLLVALLTLMVLGKAWGRAGAIALLLLAVVWIPFNKPIEGRILYEFNDARGLTIADVVTLIAGPLALWRLVLASRSERSEEHNSSAKQRL